MGAAAETGNYEGKPVLAGAGSKYILLELRIAAPPSQVDLSDFQLVRERAAQLGTETNLGNHDDSDYFYWSYLDASGRSVSAPPDSAGRFAVRLAFKVPEATRTGYLFYWGLYWGPLEFPAAP